ncbi:MAG TPA: nucleotidyl transferase [Syntrophorhabdus aromaticivorans]|nr:nucleotidyl transferase [Syntrophorhabdus aromaticivorans]
MSLPVAILAGGLSTRLGPLTKAIPKALIDVAGKPFIARQLDYVRQQGISRVVLCLGHLGEQVRAFVGDGAAFGLEACYSWDGRLLMGTGGALRRALPLLGKHFFVLYGDSYLLVDLGTVERGFVESGKPALITVLRNDDQWDKSNVLFRDGSIIEYNKRKPGAEMKHIDYGLGVLSASLLENMPADSPFDLADIYHDLSAQGLLAGLEVSDRFYEIGSLIGLAETREYFRRKEKRV